MDPRSIVLGISTLILLIGVILIFIGIITEKSVIKQISAGLIFSSIILGFGFVGNIFTIKHTEKIKKFEFYKFKTSIVIKIDNEIWHLNDVDNYKNINKDSELEIIYKENCYGRRETKGSIIIKGRKE